MQRGLALEPASSSTGSVAMIDVPRPGEERTTNVPLASSTRSRIDARPDAALPQELPGLRRVEPAAVVLDLDPELRVVGLHADRDRGGLGVLAGVRERLLHHAVGERLQVLGESPRRPAR